MNTLMNQHVHTWADAALMSEEAVAVSLTPDRTDVMTVLWASEYAQVGAILMGDPDFESAMDYVGAPSEEEQEAHTIEVVTALMDGVKRYEVRYMCGGDGDLLLNNVTYEEAQAFVRTETIDMHCENAADMVIRELTKERIAMTTQQNAVSMEGVNKSALVSTMAAEMFQQELNPRVALIVAASWMGACDYLDDHEVFMEALIDGLETAQITILDAEDKEFDVSIDGEEITDALVAAGYLTYDGLMGDRFAELVTLRTEAYLPVLASVGIEGQRRFGYAPTKYSALAKEAIHALEATEYTVDDFMLSVALQVNAILGEDNDLEGYVIKGCQKMDSSLAYISEFKGDRRVRLYQACCHGPNGQSSDRSRALMDLYGVPQDYNKEQVMQVLRAEMADMVSVQDKKARSQLIKDANNDPVAFVIKHTELKEDDSKATEVSKPWSFVKAARIIIALHKGERPYIGMAAGKDAKCSGPQLGALMVGDQAIAAACGFTMVELDDAYHRAVEAVKKAGFPDFTRASIKKPFMGVFYGQGWMAFQEPSKDLPITCDTWIHLHGDALYGEEAVCKAFHAAITSSFGTKMIAVRQAIKAYGKKTMGATRHYMPDGSQVAMNYKVKVNVLGEIMDYDTKTYDVRVQNNAESYKFINFEMNTSEIHEGDFARNGFVNMVQATDALLARLIIVHLKRLGAKHIICVHDCFRVNMTEMHLLDQAIKNAYMDLFGNYTNKRTADLPMGTDILGLYFDGANKQVVEGESLTMVSQFFSSGNRRLQKINGVKVTHLIQALGTTYFFDK